MAYEYNPNTGKIEKKGFRAIVGSQMNMKDLFGMDEEEKKLALNALKASTAGLVGFSSMFLGLATIVSSPAAGMGLLAYGGSKLGGYARTSRNIATPKHRSKYANKNYYGMEFSSDAVRNMSKIIEQEIEEHKRSR